MTSIILLGIYAKRAHQKQINRQLSIEVTTALDFPDEEMPPRARIFEALQGSTSVNPAKSGVPAPFEEEGGYWATKRLDPPSSSSAVGQLFSAIQKNDVAAVRQHLERDADPNASLWLDSKTPIDLIFLWKRLFGESATPVHIAILNIYHRHARRRELDGSLAILELLLAYGGDVSSRHINMFLCDFPGTTEASPADFLKGLKRLTLCSMLSGSKPEEAVDAALRILKGKTRRHRDNSNIPFNMTTVEDVDKMRNFLFSRPPRGQVGPSVRFVTETLEEPQ